jgi:hypothetical protein
MQMPAAAAEEEMLKREIGEPLFPWQKSPRTWGFSFGALDGQSDVG